MKWNSMRILFLFLLFGVGIAPFAAGQTRGKGIMYIQGDGTLPFYIKLDGSMQPRYGPNHCIITGVTNGLHQLEILFQQNKHEPVYFNVTMNEDTALAYLLYERENIFTLYDLNSKNYIQPTIK